MVTRLRADSLPDLPDAACRAGDPREYDKVFFFEGKSSKRTRRAIALVCGACPARLRCLEWAVEHKELGVWGGTTVDQRKAMRKRFSADEKLAQIRALNATGMNDTQIAREIGASATFVSKHRRLLGLPVNHDDGIAAASERRAKIAALHAQGLADCEIAPILGLTRRQVNEDRARLGLPTNRRAS